MWGNISTGCISTHLYPLSSKYAKSLAKVDGLHETYTTLSGFIDTIVSNTFSSHPFLGGSTTTTFAVFPSLYILGTTSSAFPT